MIFELILICAVLGTAPEPAVIIREAALRPNGKRYRAVVPDTLDLAERAKMSVHGLTGFLASTPTTDPTDTLTSMPIPVLLRLAGRTTELGKDHREFANGAHDVRQH